MALRRGIAALVLAVVGLPVVLFVAGIVLLCVFATRGQRARSRRARPASGWATSRRASRRHRRPNRRPGRHHAAQHCRESPQSEARSANRGRDTSPVYAGTAVLGQGAGAARCDYRFPAVAQTGDCISRVWRRSRILPRQCRRSGVSAADKSARSHRYRVIRGLPARGARQDRCISRFRQIGPYKTAANQLTQRGFTDAHREMAESLNRDLYDQLVQGVADGDARAWSRCARCWTKGRLHPKPLTARASSTTSPTLISSTIELLS